MIELETTVRLRCAACKATFLYVAALDGVMPDEPNSLVEAARAFQEVARAVDQLRELALQTDWTHIIRAGRDVDLCPQCREIEPDEA